MRISIYLILLTFLLIPNKIIYANEIEIISDNVKILDNGKIIKSINTKAIIKKQGLEIQGNDSLYDKNKQELIFKKNVLFLIKLKMYLLKLKKLYTVKKRIF